MNKKFYDDFFNKRVNKIIISDNSFSIVNEKKVSKKFNNYNDLKNLVNYYFMDNEFRDINIYKIVKNGNYDNYVKIGVINDNRGNEDMMILCDKEYVSMVKYFLFELNLEYISLKKYKKQL